MLWRPLPDNRVQNTAKFPCVQCDFCATFYSNYTGILLAQARNIMKCIQKICCSAQMMRRMPVVLPVRRANSDARRIAHEPGPLLGPRRSVRRARRPGPDPVGGSRGRVGESRDLTAVGPKPPVDHPRPRAQKRFGLPLGGHVRVGTDHDGVLHGTVVVAGIVGDAHLEGNAVGEHRTAPLWRASSSTAATSGALIRSKDDGGPERPALRRRCCRRRSPGNPQLYRVR